MLLYLAVTSCSLIAASPFLLAQREQMKRVRMVTDDQVTAKVTSK